MQILRCLILAILTTVSALACNGDCKSCHSQLDYENDSRHAIMLNCITCHTAESMEGMDMGMGSCGQNCFECHEVDKVTKVAIPDHFALYRCISCHTKLHRTGPNVPSHDVPKMQLKPFWKEIQIPKPDNMTPEQKDMGD